MTGSDVVTAADDSVLEARGPALEARGVFKRYPDGTEALAGVDLAVAAGESVALVGESGSGKTTLLRTFNRMVEPSAGEVRVRGRSVAHEDPVALRRGIGYVQQEGGLLPHWTVAKNVALVPEMLGEASGWPAARRRERVREVLELVGLPAGRYGERYPRELSGGQRQRVAFARALAADPDVVLLDEPFGALDALTRVEIRGELEGLLARLGKTLLLVTHDLGEAFAIADRVAVMLRGRVVRIGTPEALEREPGDEYVERLLRVGRSSK
jgi:osmoprotectant transport system ATP-binding protein